MKILSPACRCALEAVGAVETGKNGEFMFRNVPDGLHEVATRRRRAADRLRCACDSTTAGGLVRTRHPAGGVRIDSARVDSRPRRPRHEQQRHGRQHASPQSTARSSCSMTAGGRSERSADSSRSKRCQSGEHTVTLLADSLPEGALIAGEATQVATLGRDRMAVELPFLVSIETRAEIRKVFPDRQRPPLPKPRRAAAPRREGPEPSRQKPMRLSRSPTRRRRGPSRQRPALGTFALQIAAFDDPLRARTDGRQS